MSLKPRNVQVYHVFLASPGDVNAERQHVRRFFDDYNRHTAYRWNARFEVIDWDNYATIGVGRPQELITRQTLEKFKPSLALVVGIMAQRFGSPTGKAESGTEEEFNWAKQCHDETDEPEIKWFFRKVEKLELPADPDEADKALDQWKQVRAFRQRMHDLNDPIFYTEYPSPDGFARVFDHDLNLWLNAPERPWATAMAASRPATIAGELPPEFDSDRYRTALLQKFDKLNFDMLDSTGTHHSGVRLWSVFVPQSARECHQYNPRLLEIPKEHQQRLLNSGEINAKELAETERQAERLRREYFNQPLRPVLEVLDNSFRDLPSRKEHRLVILGDPGSGKSSLIRYLALRWASIADRATRDTQPIPLVIDLNSYARWKCDGQKGFARFLEEAPVWHDWPAGLLQRLLSDTSPQRQQGTLGDNPSLALRASVLAPRANVPRIVLLLDGLDEIFDPQAREDVVNDIQRFSREYTETPIVVTSRAVGYQPSRLRDAEFRHFMLQDLDAAQIDTFIDRWHEQTFDDASLAAPKRERLKKAIQSSKSIAMLAGNPLLLTMMAILNRNQELPRDRIDLYGQATRLLLHQWDIERALTEFPGMRPDIGWREKHDMLRRIAAFMQAGPGGLKGNMIDGPTLTRLIEDYLHTELNFPQARAAARAVVEQLRQRNFILCFVGADSYGFVHRTFLEYFCAADIVHQFNIAKTLDAAGLLALFEHHCRRDEWREALRLICGQIDEQFVGQIVERLATRTDLNRWDGLTTLPELPLAIYCLSEVPNLGRMEAAGAMLMDRVIQCFTRTDATTWRMRNFLYKEIVVASRELGPRWPGRQQLTQCALTQPRLMHGDGIDVWPEFVAVVEESRDKIETLSRHSEWNLRLNAIRVLAEKWPDESTRELLQARATDDLNKNVRKETFDALVEKWPDEYTREMLRARAVEDQDWHLRSFALRVLAAKWPDESTQKLLRARAIADQSELTRREAFTALGMMHSEFARILPTIYLDGTVPYCDPREPIPREHIERAAEKVGIAAGDVDAAVADLSRFLGWDVTQGAKPRRATKRRREN